MVSTKVGDRLGSPCADNFFLVDFFSKEITLSYYNGRKLFILSLGFVLGLNNFLLWFGCLFFFEVQKGKRKSNNPSFIELSLKWN